jgi:hypothetical protein
LANNWCFYHQYGFLSQESHLIEGLPNILRFLCLENEVLKENRLIFFPLDTYTSTLTLSFVELARYFSLLLFIVYTASLFWSSKLYIFGQSIITFRQFNRDTIVDFCMTWIMESIISPFSIYSSKKIWRYEKCIFLMTIDIILKSTIFLPFRYVSLLIDSLICNFYFFIFCSILQYILFVIPAHIISWYKNVSLFFLSSYEL